MLGGRGGAGVGLLASSCEGLDDGLGVGDSVEGFASDGPSAEVGCGGCIAGRFADIPGDGIRPWNNKECSIRHKVFGTLFLILFY